MQASDRYTDATRTILTSSRHALALTRISDWDVTGDKRSTDPGPQRPGGDGSIAFLGVGLLPFHGLGILALTPRSSTHRGGGEAQRWTLGP
jgi:hypothetical protein